MPGMRSATVGIWTRRALLPKAQRKTACRTFSEALRFLRGQKTETIGKLPRKSIISARRPTLLLRKSLTCYYIQSIDEKLPVALEILLDMFCDSVFPEEEIEKEKGVILEEIAMSQDTPDDLLHDKLAETFFTGTELSKTILGPAENIRRFTRQNVLDYKQKHYYAENIIVAIAGKYEKEALRDQLEKRLGGIASRGAQQLFGPKEGWEPKKRELAIEKDIEQVNLGMGFPMYGFLDDRKYAGSILCSILGGGMAPASFRKCAKSWGRHILCIPSRQSIAAGV